MKVTILGCGTSTGVPVIGCHCKVCESDLPANNRTRSSVYLETDKNEKILIDTTPDLRVQALKNKIEKLDAVLFTHDHADHLHGIDDLRAINFAQKKPINCFGPPETMEQIKTRFAYIFSDAVHLGGGLPQLILNPVEENSDFRIKKRTGSPITPLECEHGNSRVYGYRIGDFAYVTDTSKIPDATLEKMQNLKLLVLDCLRITPTHRTHLTLDKSLKVVEALKPKQTVMTHMTHDVDFKKFNEMLFVVNEHHMNAAYDGMEIDLELIK